MITRYAFIGILVAASLHVSAATPASKGPPPNAILQSLYKVHSAKKGPFYDRQRLGGLERYFTKDLATLIANDARESKGEVGAIDFDPLYGSQDPLAKDFKISAPQSSPDGGEVVHVTFVDDGKPRDLRFHFEQQADRTWRISDIHYSEGRSLRQLLQRTASPHAKK